MHVSSRFCHTNRATYVMGILDMDEESKLGITQ
jgi:hypothetical protein